ncbi:uncharacterized protein LOC125430604 [Sphaerodactylus townsendi]|uniref:uncharacterized protein LOC125430604 n=1 Tax=Sphaerodactylus townsendi TaxID=933632 RepID=UPI00202667A0|nr:uncharacterized protein LOC125430604 [Sphaerodactylus townsendi]
MAAFWPRLQQMSFGWLWGKLSLPVLQLPGFKLPWDRSASSEIRDGKQRGPSSCSSLEGRVAAAAPKDLLIPQARENQPGRTPFPRLCRLYLAVLLCIVLCRHRCVSGGRWRVRRSVPPGWGRGARGKRGHVRRGAHPRLEGMGRLRARAKASCCPWWHMAFSATAPGKTTAPSLQDLVPCQAIGDSEPSWLPCRLPQKRAM